jgi:osmoprotectant transport system permease protein
MIREEIAGALRVLPGYLAHHVILSAAALALGLAISLPLALAAVRRARLRWALLGCVSLIQTIPSLALMALFYPLLLALSALVRHVLGHGFSAFGFLPALGALTLYSMLPIVRNIVTGIMSLDPDLIEAARGVGMTERQRLLRVELPLAAPFIMAGIRTAAVWVIGTATLATPIGQTSLGNYIFTGLQTENWVWVLFGCGVSAALALVVDQALGLIEGGAVRRKRWRVLAGTAALAAGVALAALPLLVRIDAPPYVVGAKNFTEQYVLAQLIKQRLEDRGEHAVARTGLGSAVIFRALAQNDIDVYVDYSGTIWTNVMRRTDHPSRAAMLSEMKEWLMRTYGVTLLGPLGFENAYALAMRRDRAQSMGIKSIADLARHAPALTIGSGFEFFARPEWSSLRDTYGLSFAGKREFQSTFMYKAVASGEVDVISAFSSDGRIAGYNLLLLNDPLHAIPPYDAIVMIAPKRAHDRKLLSALQPLLGHISPSAMRKANDMVDRPDDPAPLRAAARALDAQL